MHPKLFFLPLTSTEAAVPSRWTWVIMDVGPSGSAGILGMRGSQTLVELYSGGITEQCTVQLISLFAGKSTKSTKVPERHPEASPLVPQTISRGSSEDWGDQIPCTMRNASSLVFGLTARLLRASQFGKPSLVQYLKTHDKAVSEKARQSAFIILTGPVARAVAGFRSVR
jgi:hypothetical protein